MRIKDCIIFIFVILFFIQFIEAGSTKADMKVKSRSYLYQRIGIYSKDEVSFKNEVDPYGIWEFNFTSDIPSNHSTEVMILTSKEYKKLGVTIEHNTYLCCTETMVEYGYCKEANYLAYTSENDPSKNRSGFYYTKLEWISNQTSYAYFNRTLKLTGDLWYLVILNCGPTSYQMTGQTIWRNPYGWVIGQNFPMLIVNPLMMVLFFGLTVYWGISSYVYRKDIMGLQVAIGFVCGISMLSNALAFGVNIKYNQNGINDHVFNTFDALFVSLKLTLSRVLLLLVCMGYTITKKKLTKTRITCISALALLYFAAVASEAFVLNSRKDGRGVSTITLSLLSVFIVFTNAAIMIWACIELLKTIQKLTNQKENVKKMMYKKLAIILVVAFLVSTILYFVEYILTMRNALDGMWKAEFIFSAYWEIAFFVIITSIAIIWRPNMNNKRFAYSQELPTNDADAREREAMEEDDDRNRHEMAVINIEESEVVNSEVTEAVSETNAEESEEEEEEDDD